MTPQEFTANAIALVGGSTGWVVKTAQLLGINRRTVQRIAAGGVVSDNLARALIDAMGELAPQAVHAEWINGEGEDGREYLIHTRRPRFRAVIYTEGDDYDIDKDAGIQYQFDDSVICAIQWIDPCPDDVAALLERACDAIAEIAAKHSNRTA